MKKIQELFSVPRIKVLKLNLSILENLIGERKAGGGNAGPNFVAGVLALARQFGFKVTAIQEGREQTTKLRASAESCDEERVKVLEDAQKHAEELKEEARSNRTRAKTIDDLLNLVPPENIKELEPSGPVQ